MRVVAVVVVGAASEVDVLTPLGDVPIVVRSARALGCADSVVVRAPPDLRDSVARACSDAAVPVVIWPHGRQRPDVPWGDGTITLGSEDVGVVHDAARPLAPAALTDAVVDAVRAGHAAAVPVLPLADTVKRVDTQARIRSTVDRAAFRVVQTPQAFRGDLLSPVLIAAARDPSLGWTAVDPPVHTVAGHPLAFPLHRPWDRELAELLVAPG